MISLIIVIIAAIAKALQDLSADDKLPVKYNKDTTWPNKYRNGFSSQGPAFFGSTTFLIFLTDLYHFAQMIFLTSMFLAIVLYKPFVVIIWDGMGKHIDQPIATIIFDFLIYRAVFGLTFELFYSKILVKRKS